MSTAVAKFIDELVLHFPRRETSEADEIAWARSMTRNLEGFSADVLEKASQIIIDTCDRRDFQWLPKQCKEACFEAKKCLDAAKPKLKFHGPKADANHDDREKLAYELILGPLGRQAAREGWIHSLFTYTRDHMRLPVSDSEIGFCKKAAREFDKAFEDCRGANPMSPQGKLVGLGMSMLEKRSALQTYVETGVLP